MYTDVSGVVEFTNEKILSFFYFCVSIPFLQFCSYWVTDCVVIIETFTRQSELHLNGQMNINMNE